MAYHDATLGSVCSQRGSGRLKLWTWSATSPFCRPSQDNWDDEDEDEEKKAEVTKTGTAGELPPMFRVGFPHVEVFLFYIPEPKVSEKKKLMEKIKEKENRLKKKQEELTKNLEDEVCGAINALFQLRAAFASLVFLQEEELSLEEQLAEKLRVKKLQEESDLELTKDAFGEDRRVEKRFETRRKAAGHWCLGFFQAWAAPPTA